MMILLVVLVSILFFHVLPEILLVFGLSGLVVLFAGFIIAWLAERRFSSNESSAQVPGLMWLVFLLLHSFIDGVSLFMATTVNHLTSFTHQLNMHNHAHSLGFGVIIHRAIIVPLIWKYLIPYSFQIRVATMTLIALGTLAGYYMGNSILINPKVAVGVEALVTGGLLHINLEVLKRIRRRIGVGAD